MFLLSDRGNMNWKALHAIDSSLLVLALDTEGINSKGCITKRLHVNFSAFMY